MRKRCLGDFSWPAAFAACALLLTLAYLVCDSLGWREYTGILSGTAPAATGSNASRALCGLIYIALYFAYVLLVPNLLLAAALLFLIRRRLA